ncbi:hypothetical protein BRN96_19225, partial [Xanthomonas oryzae pv. oryzae]
QHTENADEALQWMWSGGGGQGRLPSVASASRLISIRRFAHCGGLLGHAWSQPWRWLIIGNLTLGKQ